MLIAITVFRHLIKYLGNWSQQVDDRSPDTKVMALPPTQMIAVYGLDPYTKNLHSYLVDLKYQINDMLHQTKLEHSSSMPLDKFRFVKDAKPVKTAQPFYILITLENAQGLLIKIGNYLYLLLYSLIITTIKMIDG